MWTQVRRVGAAAALLAAALGAADGLIVQRRVIPDGDNQIESRGNGGGDDLDLGVVTIALRFVNLTIPAGSTIKSASVAFTCNNNDDFADDEDNKIVATFAFDTSPFGNSEDNINSRELSEVTVDYIPRCEERGLKFNPPLNVKALLEAAMQQPDFNEESSLVLMFLPDTARGAKCSAFPSEPLQDENGDEVEPLTGSETAPELTVEFELPAEDDDEGGGEGLDKAVIIGAGVGGGLFVLAALGFLIFRTGRAGEPGPPVKGVLPAQNYNMAGGASLGNYQGEAGAGAIGVDGGPGADPMRNSSTLSSKFKRAILSRNSTLVKDLV